MSILDDAAKLETGRILAAIGVFFVVLAPGFLTIYLFKPALIVALDTSKLVIFSSSLSLPLVVVNLLFIGYGHERAQKKDPNLPPVDRMDALGGALVLAALIVYPSLLLAYLISLQFKGFLIAIAVLQLLFGLGAAQSNHMTR
jgi:hypothetical protein